ncbi:hypothetical protein AKO1_005876 [Acrasis kona]|uniref:Uncharacterized protein n=1 Tax=Acrasis kona TaxID=1008807 RepID=A0AAW2YJR5_9EUKA
MHPMPHNVHEVRKREAPISIDHHQFDLHQPPFKKFKINKNSFNRGVEETHLHHPLSSFVKPNEFEPVPFQLPKSNLNSLQTSPFDVHNNQQPPNSFSLDAFKTPKSLRVCVSLSNDQDAKFEDKKTFQSPFVSGGDKRKSGLEQHAEMITKFAYQPRRSIRTPISIRAKK